MQVGFFASNPTLDVPPTCNKASKQHLLFGHTDSSAASHELNGHGENGHANGHSANGSMANGHSSHMSNGCCA